MNHCSRGRELLLDLQRSDFLPPWDEDGLRTVLNEMMDVHKKMKEITEEENGIDSDAKKVNLVYHFQCLNRNRRYVNRLSFAPNSLRMADLQPK